MSILHPMYTIRPRKMSGFFMDLVCLRRNHNRTTTAVDRWTPYILGSSIQWSGSYLGSYSKSMQAIDHPPVHLKEMYICMCSTTFDLSLSLSCFSALEVNIIDLMLSIPLYSMRGWMSRRWRNHAHGREEDQKLVNGK